MNEERLNWNITAPNASRTMPPLPQGPCKSCGKTIESAFRYCPHCGKSQEQGAAWYYHPIWILLLALLILGPFALPLVWKSSRMNPTEKAVMAAAILAYTAVVLYFMYWTVALTLKTMNELLRVMGPIQLR